MKINLDSFFKIKYGFIKVLIPIVLSLGALTSCSNSGLQGTSLYSKFQGISSAEALSPSSIRLTWGLDAKYTEYRIYENDAVTPAKKETFGMTTVSNLQAGTTYYYLISGYSEAAGENFVGDKISVMTMNHFTGLKSDGIILKSSNEVKLSWTMNSATTKFKIYYKNKTGTWDLNSPATVVENDNQYTLTGLTTGQEYCFYIKAEYLDGTSEPAASSEADLNSAAPCQLITAPMPSLPTISINSVTFGDFPWFWTANGDTTYKTEIYDSSTNNRIASRIGNGYFRSTVSLNQGNKNFYALVSNATGNVSRVDLNIISNKAVTSTAVRKMNSTGSIGPIFPPILSDGKGPQNLGTQVVSGDFNCDGLPDIAVSANASVPFSTKEHYSGIGSVTVYYTRQYIENDANGDPVTKYGLKTDVAPSATAVAPNPQLISYPIDTSSASIGTKLAVGNFNGDCYQKGYDAASPNGSPARGNCDYIYTHFTTPTAQLIRNTKKCDDLVVNTKAGYFYVVYGDPVLGLVSGSMSNTAGSDEQTCDSASSSCRTSKYNVPTGYNSSSFGRAIAVGDFNNDGFDDIAVSAPLNGTNIDDILVYRGDSLGIYPYGSSYSFSNIRADSSVGLAGAEIISSSSNDFGFSLTAVPNSRLCKNGSPASSVYRTQFLSDGSNQNINGLDTTKCADLIIGSPKKAHGSNTGSIYSCRGSQPTVGDKQKITSWTCREHYPNSIASELISDFGYSLVGVANQNGYPVGPNVLGTALSLRRPNVWGALFVGAPSSTINTQTNVGSVYGYYLTDSNGNNVSKGIQTVLGSAGGAHTVGADNAVPCDRVNSTCVVQRIYPSPAQVGMKFGFTLSSVGEKAGSDDPWMPMLAVGSPYRDNINTSGQTVTDAGALYLFRGDISTFMNQIDNGIEITQPKYNPTKLTACSNGDCTWLSGGVSPFGSTIVYSNTVSTSANLGLGGAAGFNSLADYSFNNDTQTDVFVSAPNDNTASTANGSLFGFFSTAGSFSPTVVTPSLTINTNQSLEGNYKFEEAKVVGDINGDGYDDVMTHINNNNQWVVAIYYGSANGLIQSPTPSYNAVGTQPKLFESITDTKLGEQIFRAGDLNGDGYADVLILSSNGLGSYIYYGSSNGLVTNVEPDISPVGKNPLRFAVNGTNAVTFDINKITYEQNGMTAVQSYNGKVQSVTVGKFNNDIYDDIAIRVRDNYTIPASIQSGSLNYSGTGRVFILYGSSSGPKINTATGRILLQDGSGNPADVVSTNPCDALDNSNCKIQMLTSPNASSLNFGFSLARRNLYSVATSEYDGLLVSDPTYNSNAGIVYVFKGDVRGLNPVPIQNLTPRDTNTNFGYTIVEVGDINGDLKKDIAVSAYNVPSSSTRAQVITIFFGKQVQSQSAYGGANTDSLSDTSFWTPAILDNQISTDFKPQVINPVSSVSTDYFGYGMTGLGDFNRDGYADLAINVSNGDYNVSGNVSQTGYVLIFFGSADGLQIQESKITPTPYPRCYQGTSAVCDPYQVFLPQFSENDFTHINPFSVGDLNGDGLPDLVVGAAGRSHPSGKGISTGVIYVLY